MGLPVIGGFSLLLFPKRAVRQMKLFALNVSLLNFLVSLNLWIFFDNSTPKFQFVQQMDWVSLLNMNFYIGVDGISLFFILLTTFLVPVCFLISWQSVNHLVKEFLVAFLFLESFMIAVFCMLDLLLFYVFFESVLIPMFLIIGVWGSRERKIRAAYQFFLYTLIGSLFMLLAILLIY